MSTRIFKWTVVLIEKKLNKTLSRNETETNAFWETRFSQRGAAKTRPWMSSCRTESILSQEQKQKVQKYISEMDHALGKKTIKAAVLGIRSTDNNLCVV